MTHFGRLIRHSSIGQNGWVTSRSPRLITLFFVVAGLTVLSAADVAPAATSHAVASASPSPSPTCPSAQCPYTAPTSTETGFSEDVLARLNIERSQTARNYVDNGQVTQLTPLTSDPVLTETAQAFAEYLA